MSARTVERGLTRVEVAAVVVSVALLIVLLLVLNSETQGTRRIAMDATQLSQVFKAIDTFGKQFDGVYPTPGMIDTIGQGPGAGAEDVSQNTTANLYSSLIAQNYLTPHIVMAPDESNPLVSVKSDYDFDAYDPVNDVYWDRTFVADLETGSNASYAHMPLHGKRARQNWRNTMDSQWILLGNRGPADGKPDPASYTTDSKGRWSGNVVFADGHVEFLETMTPGMTGDEEGQLRQDNIFANETQMDIWLTFTKSISAEDIVVQFD